LLLGEPGTGDVVRGVVVHPAVETPATAEETARRLAAEARDRFATALGLGLATSLVPTELALYEGTVGVALAGETSALESFPLRAAFGEVQRRAALHAADVLRRALVESESTSG
jgi:hypothetical protein